MRYAAIALFIIIFTAFQAAAGDVEKVVVTATRIETPVEEVASDVTVIDSEEIEKSQKKTVAELLKDVPALDVVRTGGPGGDTSVFIRGAKSEHTLVMIDGIEINDPISTGRTFDFADLTVDNIERIEIIKGPQSTLYGSDAMGGVINIITKRGAGRPRLTLSAEAGSLRTYRESAGISGGSSVVNYSLTVSREDTDGISAASEKDGNTEKDGYENTTLSTRFGISPLENLGLDLVARYTDSRQDIDNAGGAGGDDPNNVSEAKKFYFRSGARLLLMGGRFENRVGYSLTDHERENNNGTDPDHPSSSSTSSFDSRFYKVDWQGTFRFAPFNTLIAGAEYEEERGESKFHSESAFGPFTSNFDERAARTTGYYIEDSVSLGGRIFATAGLRTDHHNRFGSETTYRLTATYEIKETGTRVKATFGTGFKAPSLFQLFSQYGDVNLQPETSTGWDAGLEQALFEEMVSLGVTYFENNFDDLIDFDSGTSKYKNISGAETSGIEVYATLRPINGLILRSAYTYTDTLDRTTGMSLLRRATHKVNFTADYAFSERGDLFLDINYVGAREDNDFSTFPATRVTLDPYTLVNLSASYKVSKNFTFTGRIENLFDQDYEEVKGYGTPGIAAYGGIRMTF